MMSDIPRLIKHCLNPEFFKSSIYERVKEIRYNYFHE